MTGRRQGEDVEIVSGVSESDRIVAQGAGFLGDNDIVRLAPGAATNGAAR